MNKLEYVEKKETMLSIIITVDTGFYLFFSGRNNNITFVVTIISAPITMQHCH